MSFPRYSAYKNSGVDWLGPVPAHWLLAPAKYQIASLSGGQSTKNTVSQEPLEGLFNAYSASGQDIWMEEYEFDCAGIVLSAVGARCGKAFKADGRWGVVANTHCLFPKNGACRDYLWYLTNREQWWERGGTAQPFIKVRETLSRKWCFPDPQEQAAIAIFLDRETAKIDALVEEQRRLIELLKEKRQTVISQAVTKGLKSNVPMKDSGVEWLGEVPAHWDVLKAAHIGRLFGSDQIEEAMITDSGALPFIKVASLDGDGFSIRSWDWFVDSSIEHLYKPKTHFIVFPKRGAAIFLNKVNVVDRPALIDPNLMGWEMNGKAISHFMAFCLKVRRLDELADVSTVPQINNKHIYPEKFPVPPTTEQAEIVDFIGSALAQIDALMEEAVTASNLLHERRSALISAAVTGKIDVRGLVPQPQAVAA